MADPNVCRPCQEQRHGFCVVTLVSEIDSCLCAASSHQVGVVAETKRTWNAANTKNLDQGKERFTTGKTDATSAQLKLAEDSKTPADTLDWLASCPSWRVREAVARNPNTTEVTLAKMLWADVPGVLVAIARRVSNPSMLVWLWDNGDTRVRSTLTEENGRVREVLEANPDGLNWLRELRRLAEMFPSSDFRTLAAVPKAPPPKKPQRRPDPKQSLGKRKIRK